MNNFITKDSGKRTTSPNGFTRDVQDDKPDLYQWMPMSIPYKEGLWHRMGMLAQRGAQKYGRRNWELAGEDPKSAAEELERFKSSALRHMMQYLHGETDEDHSSAVCFNLICAEMVKYKIDRRQMMHDAIEVGVDYAIPGKDLSVRVDGMEDCKGASCECQPWNQETPWTEEEHDEAVRIMYYGVLEVPAVSQQYSPLETDFDTEHDSVREQLIISYHLDFAWVWEDDA